MFPTRWIMTPLLTVGAAIAMSQLGQAQVMKSFLENYQADLGTLSRFYRVEDSTWSRQRLKDFYQSKLAELNKLDFDKLDRDDQADWLLTRNLFQQRLRENDLEAKKHGQLLPFLPFESSIVGLIKARQEMRRADPEKSAATLEEIRKSIQTLSSKFAEFAKGDKTTAYHAAATVSRLDRELREWFEYFNGYDPLFGWWCSKPYEMTHASLVQYAKDLREKVVGLQSDDKTTIIGRPAGRDALIADLQFECIPYTPEELIEIANKEYAWCEAEMKKASRELGFGDDWHKALEHVKSLHVKPGEQPDLIRTLALEAIDFVEKNDLVTVPDLAKETWRMDMMSPERQKVSPFFLGGETIIVSFPTDTMTHDEKLMSLRANNIHFARATVHHELIPGHHLQMFMMDRYKVHRAPFNTPFSIEGWALWFEFLLWDKGFAKSPENRIGMLFWRMHRCVRIQFSLGFHLGQLTPQECIKMLIDKVGHEPSTAEGEVRRSFAGGYPPLYQAAYMLGALQFRQLSEELVGTGKMTPRQFHDAILKENCIPIAMLRSILLKTPWTKDYEPNWRFYNPTK